MVYKRVVANLRAQNWLAICIELAIVIFGVFIGTQVANWNEERLERRQTQRMLLRLQPELDKLLDFHASARSYYRITRAYATTAFAGWQGEPTVSDRDFVIAAYQASQIYATPVNGAIWATIFGADRLRTIDDPGLRDNLAAFMSADTSTLELSAVDTPYRRNVRRVIPVELQDAIRKQCGDRISPDNWQSNLLPETCDLDVPPAAAAAAAAALRAQPGLVDDLRWHTAATAAFLEAVAGFEVLVTELKKQLESLD
jgi:hypothetical protein